MKKCLVTIILVIFFGSSNIYGQSKEIKNFITGKYANEVWNIICNPDTVVFCNLEEVDSNSDPGLLFYKKKNCRVITEFEKEKFLNILLHDTQSYKKGMVLLSSEYIPEYVFLVRHKNEFLEVVISNSDMTWSIIYNETEIFHNRFPSGNQLKEFVIELGKL